MINPIYLFNCREPVPEPENFYNTLSDIEIKDTIKIILEEGSHEDIAALAKAVWGGDWEFISREEYLVDFSEKDLSEYGDEVRNANCFFDWTPNQTEGVFHWDLTRK